MSAWVLALSVRLPIPSIVPLNTSMVEVLRRPIESALRPAVAVMDQATIMLRLARIERLFQCIKDEVGSHRRADAPTHDASGKHVDDKGHVQPALPGRDVGEVRDPQLVRALGPELPIDPVQRAKGLAVADRRAHPLVPPHASQPLLAHQPFHRAPRHRHALPPQLPPDLVSAIDLPVGLPHAFNLRHQDLITPDPGAATLWVIPKRHLPSIARWGDLQDFADRLDPMRVTVCINEVPQDLSRRSSSAWAKNALASFSISLARRSSLTSRSSSFTRCFSAVIVPC